MEELINLLKKRPFGEAIGVTQNELNKLKELEEQRVLEITDENIEQDIESNEDYLVVIVERENFDSYISRF
ncbi:hypothetical protein [Staphylococcus hominis]|uniref:hypothetical protein n=1 Tax=Staphylococcus hominis TaxID=1290 RepID=UPI0012DD8A55|nr:hypothetical protein [Staphylococcus hominis]MCI2846632.1 hypothetical protein [Staphylococcus hominis]MCI2848834.1 hypothetical protein [Staphylococcus hominis]MCI2855388.1 hypothetical protein [Staphylococcus hominis]QGR78802.1 hypothetical protein FOC54_01975 [Staphylococcus hominis]